MVPRVGAAAVHEGLHHALAAARGGRGVPPKSWRHALRGRESLEFRIRSRHGGMRLDIDAGIGGEIKMGKRTC